MGRLITVLSLLLLLTLWSQSDVHNYVQDSTAIAYFPANDFVYAKLAKIKPINCCSNANHKIHYFH